MGSQNIFLWWGIVLLSIIDSIELRKLIDIDKINYKFPCGSVQCDGIRQYCSDEQTCLFCNEAVCRAKNRPGQCTLQCEKGEIDATDLTTTPNTTYVDSINCDTWTCTYRLKFWEICTIVVGTMIFGILVGMVLLNVKRRLASKGNNGDSLCVNPFRICRRRKKDINALLRKYHATEQHPPDNIV